MTVLACHSRQANHPRIVEVISIYISKKNELSIVMEFMAGGNLKDYLKEHSGQGKIFTVRFIEDIGSAIDHLHSLDIMHRDVKPENIFVSTFIWTFLSLRTSKLQWSYFLPISSFAFKGS